MNILRFANYWTEQKYWKILFRTFNSELKKKNYFWISINLNKNQIFDQCFFFLFSENYVELKPFLASITNSGFLVRNKGCRIPDMDPFDSAIVQYIQREKPLVCEHGNHLPLVDSNDTALHVNPDAINHFYNNSEEIDCCWRPFWRMKNEDNVVTSVRLIILFLL